MRIRNMVDVFNNRCRDIDVKHVDLYHLPIVIKF